MKRIMWLLMMLVLLASLFGCSRAAVEDAPDEQIAIIAVSNPPPMEVFQGTYFYDWVDTAEVTYSDGSTAMQPVIWDSGSLNDTGIQVDTVLRGTLADTDIQVEQIITVRDKVLQIDEQGLTEENWADRVEEKLKTLPVGYSFSPDRTLLVYAVETVGSDLFLWREGQSVACPVDLRNDLYHEVEWSSDSDFFFVVASTDVYVGVYVLDARNNRMVTSFGSFMGAVWSPTAHEILFAPMTDVKLIKDMGDGLACEIAVYDVDSGATTVLVPGQPDCLFGAQGWQDADTVLYCREDLITGEVEQFIAVTLPR